jgi:hypothetical protein
MDNATITDFRENLLSVFTFDITSYFDYEYQIISTEDSPAVQIVDFEVSLPNVELEIFDTLHLMVMFDKFFVASDTHMNATFKAKTKGITVDEIKKTTNFFHSILGTDDSKHKKWKKSDVENLKNYSFNRIWPTGMGDSFVKLAYKEDSGFELSILFLNNLLDNVGKKIVFN